MDFYLAGLIGVVAAALASGFYLGWRLGILHQKKADRSAMEHEAALRMNAKFDFGKVRGKAEGIVKLANEIAMAAKTADESVYKQFALVSKNGMAASLTFPQNAQDSSGHEAQQ
jgi:hypothetical protein